MKKKEIIKVGDKRIDADGAEWVVSRLWEHEEFTDFQMINTETGEYGSMRQEILCA